MDPLAIEIAIASALVRRRICLRPARLLASWPKIDLQRNSTKQDLPTSPFVASTHSLLLHAKTNTHSFAKTNTKTKTESTTKQTHIQNDASQLILVRTTPI